MVAKRTVGFALGGGGARGSFSAGALDYLIREAGLIPKVITGTSAGSICASVLAQARTSEEFHTAATVLRDDVIRLGVPGVAFEPQPWLTGLEGTPLAVDVRELMAGTMRPTIPADPTLAEDVLADATSGTRTTAVQHGLEVARSVVSGLAMTHKAIKGLSANAESLAVIDPLGEALLGHTPGRGPAPATGSDYGSGYLEISEKGFGFLRTAAAQFSWLFSSRERGYFRPRRCIRS